MSDKKQQVLVIKKKVLLGDDGHKTFSIRVTDLTKKRLDELSGETGRSRNQLISMMLSHSLDNCSIDTGNGAVQSIELTE